MVRYDEYCSPYACYWVHRFEVEKTSMRACEGRMEV